MRIVGGVAAPSNKNRMKTVRAICVKSGDEKPHSNSKCPKCGFKPKTDSELAKSLILSLEYEIEDEDRSKSWDELKKIGLSIQQGRPYEFDEKEVEEVIAYAHKVLSIPSRVLFVDFLRWFGPVILILIVAVWIILYAPK